MHGTAATGAVASQCGDRGGGCAARKDLPAVTIAHAAAATAAISGMVLQAQQWWDGGDRICCGRYRYHPQRCGDRTKNTTYRGVAHPPPMRTC